MFLWKESHILLIILPLFLSFETMADAPFVEYSHWGSEERREVNSPRQIDGEYQSDRLTYEFQNQWHEFWWKESKVFQYAAGSLGPSRFLTRSRLKFEESITEKFKFLLIYHEVADYTQDRSAMVFEFAYRLTSLFEISLYGQPSTLKKEDDVGLAFTTWFSQVSKLRIFFTWVDFSFNKRTEDSESYNKKPGTYGFVWRRSENKDSLDFLEFFFKEDLAMELNQASQMYAFRQTQFGLKGRERGGSSFDFIQYELNMRNSRERDTLNTDFGIEEWSAQHFDVLLQMQNSSNVIPLYGVRYTYSKWQSLQGNVIHNDILPHLWWQLYNQEKGALNHSIFLGYEMTWHRGRGKTRLRSQLDRNARREHRINFKYSLMARAKTRLNVLLTFDGDQFGTGETWEGGAIQFSQLF